MYEDGYIYEESPDNKPIYFSFFPSDLTTIKHNIIKESIKKFRIPFARTNEYFSKYSDNKFSDVIYYNDHESDVLIVPIGACELFELHKFIIRKIREKTKFWGLNRNTKIAIPEFNEVKEILNEYQYKILTEYLRTYYILLIV